MGFHLSVLFLVERSEFAAMVLDMAGGFEEVVTQICVTRPRKLGILALEVSRLVLSPDEPGVFRQGFLVLERVDEANLGEDAGGHDGADPRNGQEALVSVGVKPLERFLDGLVHGLDLARVSRDQREGRRDGDGQRLIQALVQTVGIACRLLQQGGGVLRVGESVVPLLADVADEVFRRHLDDLLRGEEVREDGSRSRAETVGKGLSIALEQRELAELEEDVGEHVGLLPCESLGQMAAVARQTLQSKELAAPPGLCRDPVDTGEVSDDERIDEIVLAEVDEGLLVVLHHLRIQAIDLCVERCQGFAGREVVRDVDTVERRGFEGYHQIPQILAGLQAGCNLLGKFHCAGTVVGDRKRLEWLLGFEVQERNDVAAGADVNPDEESSEKIRLLQKESPPFRLSVGKVGKEFS